MTTPTSDLSMKPSGHIFASMLSAAAALAPLLCGCAADRMSEPGETPGKVMLSLRFDLGDIDYDHPDSRAPKAGEISDDMPANADEKMQSLRVVILDGKGFAEHNSYWESADASGALELKTFNFPITPDDTKTVILLANEKSLPADVRTEISGIDASAGQWVDPDELKALTFDAQSADGYQLKRPLVMSDIHTVAIGNAPLTERTLPITRAAVKVSLRISNYGSSRYRLRNVRFSSLTTQQYLFPAAAHSFSAGRSHTFISDEYVPALGTLEPDPVYIAEGNSATTYSISYQAGSSSRTTTKTLDMTDLPRNTHVVINMTINKDASTTVRYAVCPWNSETINIPDFN